MFTCVPRQASSDSEGRQCCDGLVRLIKYDNLETCQLKLICLDIAIVRAPNSPLILFHNSRCHPQHPLLLWHLLSCLPDSDQISAGNFATSANRLPIKDSGNKNILSSPSSGKHSTWPHQPCASHTSHNITLNTASFPGVMKERYHIHVARASPATGTVTAHWRCSGAPPPVCLWRAQYLSQCQALSCLFVNLEGILAETVKYQSGSRFYKVAIV